MHNKNAILVNERAFRQLDAATQKVVTEAGEAATKRGWEMSKKAGEERENVLKGHGVAIAQSPKDVLDAIEVAGKGMVAEWLSTATAEEKAVYETYQKSLK